MTGSIVSGNSKAAPAAHVIDEDGIEVGAALLHVADQAAQLDPPGDIQGVSLRIRYSMTVQILGRGVAEPEAHGIEMAWCRARYSCWRLLLRKRLRSLALTDRCNAVTAVRRFTSQRRTGLNLSGYCQETAR
jgi:hypothetical protein